MNQSGGKKDDEKDIKNYSGNLNYEKFINSNIKIFNTIYLQTVAEYDNSLPIKLNMEKQ